MGVVSLQTTTMQSIKIVVLGDGGVGKTALTIQLCSNHFVEEYDPTIEDSYRKQIVIDTKAYLLEILDTAGQDDFTPLRDQWVRDGEGFVLIYSVTQRSSFPIGTFRDLIRRVKDCDDTPIILVGNKIDLESSREVSTNEGKQLALSWSCLFIETSAKTRVNVTETYVELVKAISTYSKDEPVKQPRKKNVFAKACTLL